MIKLFYQYNLRRLIKDAIEQIIGREDETATFLWHCPLPFNLCGSGFAPRQFNRSAASHKLACGKVE